MKYPFKYKVVVQWSGIEDNMYEAFVPTLMPHVQRFLPGHPTISFGDTPQEALNAAIWQAKKILLATEKLSILPPRADVIIKHEQELRASHG